MQEQVGQGALAKPSLSIIVPVFNPGQSLERLLGSLSDDERVDIIFVDDGSTDGSRERLAKYVENHRAVLVASPGKGPGTARNAGISLAEGTFLAFADADDQCRLEVLLDAVSECTFWGSDVGICGYELQNEQGQKRTFTPLGRKSAANWSDKYSVLTERAAVWGKVYRRTFLINSGVRFPDEPGAEDVVFSYKLALTQPATRVLSRVGYIYYQDSVNQLTATRAYFEDGGRSMWNLLSQKPVGIEAQALLGFVVLSGAPYLLRSGRGISNFVQVGSLIFRMLRVLGFRAMARSIKEVGKRQLTKMKIA
jgi:glycosyltransferase involved in cell wall biosynthesis